AIAVDNSGKLYVTGFTQATDFPTQNALQATLAGSQNAFVTKLDPTLSGRAALVYSTYLGGSGADQGNAIAVDSSGEAYVTGGTTSSNFPGAGTPQVTYGGGALGDAFVAKLGPTGASHIFATYLGGSASDRGEGIALGAAGVSYVAGWTLS